MRTDKYKIIIEFNLEKRHLTDMLLGKLKGLGYGGTLKIITPKISREVKKELRKVMGRSKWV